MPKKKKIILSLCGGTGAWEKPYKEAGYTVYNITLPEYDVNKYTINKLADIDYIVFYSLTGRTDLYIEINDIYGILAAPPCTQFTKATWNIKKSNRNFKQGMEIVKACMNIIWAVQENGASLKFWALENPMGYLYNFLGFPVFYFQPWQFGEKGFLATKRTAIWGYFHKPTKIIKTRTIPFINSHSKAKNKSVENKGWYSASAKERAITPAGFAKAFFRANR